MHLQPWKPHCTSVATQPSLYVPASNYNQTAFGSCKLQGSKTQSQFSDIKQTITNYSYRQSHFFRFHIRIIQKDNVFEDITRLHTAEKKNQNFLRETEIYFSFITSRTDKQNILNKAGRKAFVECLYIADHIMSIKLVQTDEKKIAFYVVSTLRSTVSLSKFKGRKMSVCFNWTINVCSDVTNPQNQQPSCNAVTLQLTKQQIEAPVCQTAAFITLTVLDEHSLATFPFSRHVGYAEYLQEDWWHL